MSDFEGRLACVIGADGTIARGYRIVKCERTGIGDYTFSISPSSATECRNYPMPKTANRHGHVTKCPQRMEFS